MNTIIGLCLGIISARLNIDGVTIKNTFLVNNDRGNKLTCKTLTENIRTFLWVHKRMQYMPRNLTAWLFICVTLTGVHHETIFQKFIF